MNDQESRLAAYVDGELDREQVQDVERLLAADPRARQMVRVQQETTALLRGACADSAYAPSPELTRLLLNQPIRTHPTMRAMMAIAASLLLVTVSFSAGHYFGRSAPVSEIAELVNEVSEYHGVFAHETDHLVDIPASRGAELAAWLGERLGRKLVIPDLSTAGLTFAGGRMLVVNGRPVAQLMYTRANDPPVGFCITRLNDPPASLQVTHRRSLDLAWWIAGGYAYMVVGALPGGQAEALAQLIVNQSRG